VSDVNKGRQQCRLKQEQDGNPAKHSRVHCSGKSNQHQQKRIHLKSFPNDAVEGWIAHRLHKINGPLVVLPMGQLG